MKNMKRKVQKGFTLIELMIVIAIVAILVALAVPAYQDYMVRTKFAECIDQAASVKLAVAENYQARNTLPTNNASAGVAFAATNYCASVVIASGVITVTSQNTGADTTEPAAVFTPTTGGGNITIWDCSIGAGAARYFPASCRPT